MIWLPAMCLDLYWCHSNHTKNGKKKPNNFCFVLGNTWTTENSFYAENAKSLLTTLCIRRSTGLHPSLSIMYLCGCCCPLSCVCFITVFFRSDLGLLSHMTGFAAQLYPSAVLSLSVLNGSFIRLTELEEKRFS